MMTWVVGTGIVNFNDVPTIDPDLAVPVGQFNGVFTRRMSSGSCKGRVKGMYRVFSGTRYHSGRWANFEDVVKNGLNGSRIMASVFDFKFVVVSKHKTLKASDDGNTHVSGTVTLQSSLDLASRGQT